MWFKRAIVFDLETHTSWLNESIRDNSFANPENYIVSVHWKVIENVSSPEACLDAPVKTAVLKHDDKATPDSLDEFLADLASADIAVAHNLKFDANWLLASRVALPDLNWCTMVAEYIFARGTMLEKSLKATAERRDVTRKKSDLIDAEFKVGKKEFSQIALPTVIEYAEADVQSCAEIFIQQVQELQSEQNSGLIPTFKMMNEMLSFLCEIEQNGINIDLDVLKKVGDDYRAEKEELNKSLRQIVSDVMGDTPINLASGPDLCAVVYSRRVIDKARWKQTFNLGTDSRGKPLYPPRMKKTQFVQEVRSNTKREMRTQAVHCDNCNGTGYIRKIKRDGTPFKNPSACPVCHKEGAVYIENGVVAGLKMIPETVQDTSVHGFKTDKATLAKLIDQAETKGNLPAQVFLKNIARLNAVNTYLDSFVTGITTYTRKTGLLHANFNQTITRTGRLSSSQPNFQNLPSGSKFPVRAAVVSRFENGWIYECDFSGLEFVCAGELSKDERIIEDILAGKDVHKQTASIIDQCDEAEVTKESRKAAKKWTFSPLYGGRGANEKPHIKRYFDEYFNLYAGLGEWHKTLFSTALNGEVIRVPSGREYKFENVRRIAGGRVSNATNICNYPVQGWSTGDLVPLSCVRAHKRFKELGLKSKLIITVHDSICVDCHPDEEEQVTQALVWAMAGVVDEAKMRWDYDFVLPLNVEVQKARNWMELEEVPID